MAEEAGLGVVAAADQEEEAGDLDGDPVGEEEEEEELEAHRLPT